MVKIDNSQSLLDADNYFLGYYIRSTMQFLLPWEVIVENVPEIAARNIIDLGKAKYKEQVANLPPCGAVFSLMTDVHFQGYSNSITKCVDSLSLLNYINRQPIIDMCVNLGDLITTTTETTHDMAVGYVAEAMGWIDGEKTRNIIGNHDINAKYQTGGTTDYSQQLTKAEQYNL